MHLSGLFVSRATAFKAATAIHSIWRQINSNMHNKACIYLKKKKRHMFRHWEKDACFVHLNAHKMRGHQAVPPTHSNITDYIW